VSLSLSTEIGPATIVVDVGFLYSKLILVYFYLIFYSILYVINYGGVNEQSENPPVSYPSESN
jgi:hypothetical protein